MKIRLLLSLAVPETISRRDGAWNLSGGSKNSSTPAGPQITVLTTLPSVFRLLPVT